MMRLEIYWEGGCVAPIYNTVTLSRENDLHWDHGFEQELSKEQGDELVMEIEQWLCRDADSTDPSGPCHTGAARQMQIKLDGVVHEIDGLWAPHIESSLWDFRRRLEKNPLN